MISNHDCQAVQELTPSEHRRAQYLKGVTWKPMQFLTNQRETPNTPYINGPIGLAADICADRVVHLALTLQIPRKHTLMPQADQVGGA